MIVETVRVRLETADPTFTADEVRALLAEVDDMQALFDLQWTRMTAATDRWRAEAPAERAHVMPDLGDLLDWLMTQIDQLAGQNAPAEMKVNHGQTIVMRVRDDSDRAYLFDQKLDPSADLLADRCLSCQHLARIHGHDGCKYVSVGTGRDVSCPCPLDDLTVDALVHLEPSGMAEPCQPIGCDNGYHLPGCVYAAVDADGQRLVAERDALVRLRNWRRPFGAIARLDADGYTLAECELFTAANTLLALDAQADAGRYPHAVCGDDQIHVPHTWGDPVHWCTGRWSQEQLDIAKQKAADYLAQLADYAQLLVANDETYHDLMLLTNITKANRARQAGKENGDA